MNLTSQTLDHQRLASVVLLLVAITGIALYLQFPSREEPAVTVREAVVTTLYPGMAAERVEELLTQPIEERIRQIPEVEHITSSSKAGVSIVHVKVYDRFVDLNPIWRNLRDKMQDVTSSLPDQVVGPMVNDEFGDVAIATVALTGSGWTMAEIRDQAERLRDTLYALDGVRKVELHGVQDERIFLQTTNARLMQFGLSPLILTQTLRGQNVIMPGGSVYTGAREVLIEPSGNFESLDDIGNVAIEIPETGDVVYLRDILDVTRRYVDPPDKLAFFNGEPAIVLYVSMMEGYDSLAFGESLRLFIDELEQSLPIGYVLEFATFQPAAVAQAVNAVTGSLYQTLAIVLVVVVLFLGVRTGLIVGSVVPFTMLFAIIVMRFLEIDLQRVSLASLIISLGLLVDNGIVVAESIGNRYRRGEDRREAAIAACRELALPLLTSSLTTILAFAPLLLAQNAAGEYTRSLSQVVAIALLGSWVLSLTLTPLLCFWFLRASETAVATKSDPFDKVRARYRQLLELVLHHRALFSGGVLLSFLFSVWSAQFIPFQFFPESDRDQFSIYLDLPAGYSIIETRTSADRLVAWLGDASINPEVEQTVAYVGYGGPRFRLSMAPLDPDPHVAFILVDVEDYRTIPAVIDRVRRRLLEHHPEASGRVKRMFLGPTETGLVELRIIGTNQNILIDYGERAEAALRRIPGAIDIRNNWENKVITVVVDIDQARARRAGVTSQDIAISLQAFFSGIQITDFREGDNLIPIVIRAEASERSNLDRIRTIGVYSSLRDVSVPLMQIATFPGIQQPSRIERRDLSRTITISAKHDGMTAVELEAALEAEMADDLDALPPGYRYEWGGESEASARAQGALFASAPYCFGLIGILLVWQFESFRKPLIIVITIPLSFTGALLGLLVTGNAFGFMAIMGLFSLAGIIINNAIVLLDRIEIEVAAGRTALEAVKEASEQRLQPIVMTTLTTILGLMPIIWSGDVLFLPMAVLISSGLALGTVMTLGMVPVLYTVFYRVTVEAS